MELLRIRFDNSKPLRSVAFQKPTQRHGVYQMKGTAIVGLPKRCWLHAARPLRCTREASFLEKCLGMLRCVYTRISTVRRSLSQNTMNRSERSRNTSRAIGRRISPHPSEWYVTSMVHRIRLKMTKLFQIGQDQ